VIQPFAAGWDQSFFTHGHALQRASELVEIPNAGGRYSSRLLPDPDQLEAVRNRLAEAIEALEANRPNRSR